MATGEQMQEAFQKQQHELQVLTARVAAMETQLQFQTARAHQAEQERSRLMENMGSTRVDRGSAMVDTKGIGQLFTLKGFSEQDFGEWTHKVRTFMLARFGDDILTALTWAARQQRIVVKTCATSQRNRMISWNTVFGDQGGEDEIENIDDFVGKLYAYLVSFTTDALNRIVRNSEEGNGLEAWRRLHSEYDPISSMRRVAILQQVQNPPRCQRVEDLGPALEDWLSKRHSRTGTDGPVRHPTTASWAWKRPSCSQMRMTASRSCSIGYWPTVARNRRDDPMEVDALSRGKRKGKKCSSGFGKEKGQNSMWNVVCWNCGKSGHCEKDCKQKWTENKEWSGKKGKSKGTSKGKGKLNSKKMRKVTNKPMDGLGMTSKLKNGGKQQAIIMCRVQHSGRMPMIRLRGNQKDELVDLR